MLSFGISVACNEIIIRASNWLGALKLLAAGNLKTTLFSSVQICKTLFWLFFAHSYCEMHFINMKHLLYISMQVWCLIYSRNWCQVFITLDPAQVSTIFHSGLRSWQWQCQRISSIISMTCLKFPYLPLVNELKLFCLSLYFHYASTQSLNLLPDPLV